MRMRKNKRGFTIPEMLITIAIIVCLSAVSFVGIMTYMKHLKITELDYAAKQIYMAAQNRISLLKTNGMLNDYIVKTNDSNKMEHVEANPNASGSIQITAYFIKENDENIQYLLPNGTIDSELREGDFYIIYEPNSASVVDVFYAEETLLADGDNFEEFYKEWRAKDKSSRMKHDPMIGYYGGESAESGNSISLRTPVINIYNEEELRVEVTYWEPTLLGLNVDAEITLTYQDKDQDYVITLVSPETEPVADEGYCTIVPGILYTSYTYTWVLDSLDGIKFRDFMKQEKAGWAAFAMPDTYGDDFTITAEVTGTSTTEMQVNGAIKTATDNSLFAKGSGDETAYIEYTRHLQNLDADTSSVSGKTKAVQRKDITSPEGYPFKPITNGSLMEYDGAEYQIRELAITTSGDSNENTGLFGALSGKETSDKVLKNISLVNTENKGVTNASAGTLVGEGKYLQITGCSVYWENTEEGSTNLRNLLGDSEKGLNYMVTGSTVGGLAGKLENSSIENSYASTLVSGATVGGLVGEAKEVTIDSSYSACYLQGNHAAGLVGNLSGGSKNEIFSSYAVGYIQLNDENSKAANTAAGFTLGQGKATVKQSYSAMLYDGEGTKYPLCEKEGDYTNAVYLNVDGWQTDSSQGIEGVEYSDLTNSEKWNEFFGADHGFEEKSETQSHPYNLQTTLLLEKYLYPGLKDVDHWGDFGAQFQNGSLVYFEKYKTNTDTFYGFAGGGIDLLEDDQTIVEDGYAVVFEGTDFSEQLKYTLTISDQTVTDEDFEYGSDGIPIQKLTINENTNEKITYYILPLPDKVVNTEYTSSDFYQKITLESASNNEEVETITCYYNPHFANAIVEDGENIAELSNNLTVEIRTPRQLYMLSKHEEYYASSKQYNFAQQLDLDYGTYTGYNLFTGKTWTQNPIGTSAGSPFRNNYNGNHHIIENVKVNTNDYQYIGLFGYNTGKVRNVVYFMNNDTKQTVRNQNFARTVYVGGLLGYNGGTVDNCAVSGIQVNIGVYRFSTVYAGGFVGDNRGMITNSAADVEHIQAITNLSSVYAAGFAGINSRGGSIDCCYAVGCITVSRSHLGNVFACGFVGENKQTVANSYAATDLTISGEAIAYGFSKDSSSNCVYLNNGNFQYNDVYSAQYTDGTNGATPTKWNDFVSEETTGVAADLGMKLGAKAYGNTSPYPYPSNVIAADGKPIHYGKWPEKMDLGVMGVYYWEKMTTGTKDSYHISVIKVDIGLNQRRVTKDSTLSTQHADGGVITEYGYGYFYSTESTVTLNSDQNIDYQSTDGKWEENAVVNGELEKLIGDEYKFHSYNTWGTQKANQGLFLTQKATVSDQNKTPVGKWTLTMTSGSENRTAEFEINPFFADSMGYLEDNTTSEIVSENVPTEMPGLKTNPYQVRSIEQLQFIDWNTNKENVDTVLVQKNCYEFPYLSYYQDGDYYGNIVERKYYWNQTHDLQGKEEETYTPIAEFYDPTTATTGFLYGWFGGVYNGNDYTINDVNIERTEGASSCVGLFGAVYNGILENIIMYSAEGDAVVRGKNSGDSRWYAIGTLAGVAGSEQGSAITNCAVAGYKVEDMHRSTTLEGWGGTGLGGLIGVSDMALANCTAVTTISVNSKDNDNIRIGGLVGSCQNSIDKCYAGGSISIDSNTTVPINQDYPKGIYVGGIVGGIYMKPLAIGKSGDSIGRSGNDLTNTLRNCYTYVELPAISSNSFIKGMYAVGGSGELNRYPYEDKSADHGYTIYGEKDENENFYLKEVVLRNNNNNNNTISLERNDLSNVTETTYEELSSETGMAYKALTANGFGVVTTQSINDAPLDGMFTYATSKYLVGQNYPFPTILTQSSSLVERGSANVHYGDWITTGIKREEGTQPIALDLFRDESYTEKLELSNLTSGGTWSVQAMPSENKDIVETSIDNNGNLIVKPLAVGNTTITVTYVIDGESFTLDIDVNVTSEVRLTATTSPIKMFTNEKVTADLKLVGVDNLELTDFDITNITVESDSQYLEEATISKVQDQNHYVLSATSKDKVGTTQLTVAYQYEHSGNTYSSTSVLAIEIIQPEITVTQYEIDFSDFKLNEKGEWVTTIYSEDLEEQIKIEVGNNSEESISDVLISGVSNFDAQKSQIWADLVETGVQITIYKDEPLESAIGLTIEFTYGGSTHQMDITLKILVTKPETGGTEGEGSQLPSPEEKKKEEDIVETSETKIE